MQSKLVYFTIECIDQDTADFILKKIQRSHDCVTAGKARDKSVLETNKPKILISLLCDDIDSTESKFLNYDGVLSIKKRIEDY